MAGDSQWPECAEVATVLQSDQAEGNDDQKDSFLMNVPTEEERCVSTKRERSYKCIPVWA